MRSYITILFPLFILVLLIQSCDSSIFTSSDNNLSKSDSLFLGFHLGMPQKDFFDLCTELNKQQKITQGPGGTTNVEYRIVDEYDSEISMRFYPTFIEEKIFEMPVTYSYVAWAPWNRQYWAEKLLPKVLERYKEIYGDDFKLINHPTQGKVYYKIDGKRRINLFIKDDQHVQAVFSDLRVEKRLKEEFEKSQTQEQAPTN
ncbi:hypothetical protein MMU07_03065 [Aquiflexum sp. LQ15W]|uniref:hypothetical protein n=1 Tax=Cognataquiflexum nitidum TaxID=2922272 RepID=UPI001F140406|nr:hypothetical protein [Cognataquiflexum nitidum]MCH6198545.1 hypothetical protein [Cognataquiflexum nitidum]